MRIRKQVYELTVFDLERTPVWEFALDEEGEEGQDEATVRPYEFQVAVDPAAGMFIVRAHLVLADGTRLKGYVTPPPPGETDLGCIQPQAVVPDGQVSFWCGIMEPEPSALAIAYARLGKTSAADVFPLMYESDVPIVGGPIVGTVPGFLVIEDSKTMRTRVIS